MFNENCPRSSLHNLALESVEALEAFQFSICVRRCCRSACTKWPVTDLEALEPSRYRQSQSYSRVPPVALSYAPRPTVAVPSVSQHTSGTHSTD